MGITTIAKNLKKTSVEIDSFGRILSSSSSESKQQEMKAKQDARARKLGFKR